MCSVAIFDFCAHCQVNYGVHCVEFFLMNKYGDLVLLMTMMSFTDPQISGLWNLPFSTEFLFLLYIFSEFYGIQYWPVNRGQMWP